MSVTFCFHYLRCHGSFRLEATQFNNFSLQSHKLNVHWLYFPKLLFVSKSLLTFCLTEKNKQTLKQRCTKAFIYLQNPLDMLSKLKTKRAKTTDYFNSIWSFLTPFSMWKWIINFRGHRKLGLHSKLPETWRNTSSQKNLFNSRLADIDSRCFGPCSKNLRY